MRKIRELFLVVAASVLAATNCGESQRDDENEGECPAGSEGCPCREGDCDAGLDCRSGLCVDLGAGGGPGNPTCPSTHEDCSGSCVMLDSDEANCGACGEACATGEECLSGTCACQAGRERCGARCIDTSSDPEHCGDCATACAEEQVCSASECADDCGDTLTQCGRSCVDTTTNAEHCGDCDAECDSGQTCDDGSCSCPSGLTPCDGACVDTETDGAHCGECGEACASGEACVDGGCDCEADYERCGSDCVPEGTCGTGGSAGAGGAAGSGGAGAMSGGGAGGAGGAGSGNGGRGGNAGNAGNGGSGGAEPGGMPVVMLLVDNSSSMYEPRAQLWDALYSALMDGTDGAVLTHEANLRFGFSSFRGPYGMTFMENDPGCAQIETVGSVNPATVAPAVNNYDEINTVYRALGEQGVGMPAVPWETPTGHALNRVTATLAAFSAMPAGRKYVVLLTDGNPNTCRVLDPQCGQDLSVAAAQSARMAGIRTLILGLGDVLAANTGCTPTAMRCGEQHLQDMANAGAGQPVEPPPASYWYTQCPYVHSGTSPATPVATYAAVGMGGTAPFYRGTTRAELRTALLTMFQRIVDGAVP